MVTDVKAEIINDFKNNKNKKKLKYLILTLRYI